MYSQGHILSTQTILSTYSKSGENNYFSSSRQMFLGIDTHRSIINKLGNINFTNAFPWFPSSFLQGSLLHISSTCPSILLNARRNFGLDEYFSNYTRSQHSATMSKFLSAKEISVIHISAEKYLDTVYITRNYWLQRTIFFSLVSSGTQSGDHVAPSWNCW